MGQGSSRKKQDGKLALDPPTQAAPATEVELPSAVSAETARLSFHVSPLSSKGLLLQQTRDALKELMQANHGGRLVKLRVFVAGSGDARRVRPIVIDFFAEKKLPLPVLTAVQAGELPKDGAQVVIESVSEEQGKRPANPQGLVFFSSQSAADPKGALDELASSAQKAGVAEMLRVTCYLDSGDVASAAQAAAMRQFPKAAVNLVQRLRSGSGAASACEGVGRGKGTNAAKLIFTGAQMAFGDKDADLRLAFQRLDKTLEPFGVSYQDVIYSSFYPVGRTTEEKLAPLATEFFHHPVPTTAQVFEGLPSPDASMSLEVIAASKSEAVRN